MTLMGISVAQVVGANARDLRQNRAGMTLDQMARAARNCGLPWSSGRVGDFEAGRVPPNLLTLYAVALALGVSVADLFAPLADVFADDEPVQINDELTVPLSALRAALSGPAGDRGDREGNSGTRSHRQHGAQTGVVEGTAEVGAGHRQPR